MFVWSARGECVEKGQWPGRVKRRGIRNRWGEGGVAQLVTSMQTPPTVRVRITAIPKRPWLRGRGPAPRARWFQWKICRGPLDEQKIPRGGARAVQPGMPFPNLYRCNKVLVYQKKKCTVLLATISIQLCETSAICWVSLLALTCISIRTCAPCDDTI